MKVLIAGASGFLGGALVEELTVHQHQVHTLVRRPARTPTEIEWHPERPELDADRLRGFAAVICLSGAGIGDRRWTPAYKQELVDSRVRPTSLLAKSIAALPMTQRPRTLISASAVGYYGDRGDELLPESADAGTGFLAELVVEWEGAAQAAADAGARVALLRTGLVLSARGGLLARLLPIFRAGAGGKLGSGRQYQPWITLADEVAAIRFVLETESLRGPINLVGPAPVRNSEFATELGRALNRPAMLPAPAFALRLALGEFADEGALASQRAVPERLEAAGFEFEHRTVRSALDWAINH